MPVTLTSIGSNSTAWSVTPFEHYGKTMIRILVAFIIFGWTTATHYCNALSINVDKDYPVDNATLNALAKQNKNPYCSSLVDCEYISDVASEGSKFASMARWFQITQSSSYEIGGKILNKFFKFSKYLLGETSFSGSSKARPSNKSDTGFLAFIIWLVFGLFTQISIVVMLSLLYVMWIPGWIGGLFAFMPLTYTINSMILKLICKFWLFIGSFIMMCVAGIVTGFPVLYEFVYLFYLFFVKQLFSDDRTKFFNEFMSRMKHLIIVFVVVAIVVAAVQLPPAAAGTMAIIVVISAAISHYFSNKDEPAKSG